MVIQVRLHAELQRYAPSSNSGILAVDVPEHINVTELMEELEIENSAINAVHVNGEKSSKLRLLADGDRVEVFPLEKLMPPMVRGVSY